MQQSHCKPNLSQANQAHRKYPYLLKGLAIQRSNQVWCTDITYIPMAKGFVYLCAVIDWHSRKVLAHRVSISMEVDFCISALNEAIEKYGSPEIFNTDQGSQFTSDAFIDVLKSNGIQISMDGKGRWIDNVMVERLWRSVKYEEVYLKAYSSVTDAKKQLSAYFEFYNLKRPHSSLDKMTPDEFYYDHLPQQNKVAKLEQNITYKYAFSCSNKWDHLYFHLPHMMIDTVKINQSLLLLTLLNCNNTADKNTMCAHFLNLLNLTVKAN